MSLVTDLNKLQSAGKPPAVVLVNGADLHPEPVKWLWPGWLAPESCTSWQEPPGQGKTTIALTAAATVTNGGRWPAVPHGIWKHFDLVRRGRSSRHLLPRLLAAGADRQRCFSLKEHAWMGNWFHLIQRAT